jgi:hypothetical protein
MKLLVFDKWINAINDWRLNMASLEFSVPYNGDPTILDAYRLKNLNNKQSYRISYQVRKSIRLREKTSELK